MVWCFSLCTLLIIFHSLDYQQGAVRNTSKYIQIQQLQQLMDPTIPSRYTPIWNRLKETGHATVVAEVRLHRRIIKAVQARRDKDLAFRHNLAEVGKKHRITWNITGTTIHFTLTFRTSIYGI